MDLSQLTSLEALSCSTEEPCAKVVISPIAVQESTTKLDHNRLLEALHVRVIQSSGRNRFLQRCIGLPWCDAVSVHSLYKPYTIPSPCCLRCLSNVYFYFCRLTFAVSSTMLQKWSPLKWKQAPSHRRSTTFRVRRVCECIATDHTLTRCRCSKVRRSVCRRCMYARI